MTIPREDLIWLAGIVEGEGCADLHKGRYPRIRVGMVDRDVVGRVASLFGSSIRLAYKQAPNKSTFHAEISGDRAAEILKALLPHMGARRSSKFAEILAADAFRREPTRHSVPGPALTRPPGIARPYDHVSA